jgi:hypothetical protein
MLVKDSKPSLEPNAWASTHSRQGANMLQGDTLTVIPKLLFDLHKVRTSYYCDSVLLHVRSRNHQQHMSHFSTCHMVALHMDEALAATVQQRHTLRRFARKSNMYGSAFCTQSPCEAGQQLAAIVYVSTCAGIVMESTQRHISIPFLEPSTSHRHRTRCTSGSCFSQALPGAITSTRELPVSV